ncbi:hypothetical protein GO986_20595 [Deinococcus sp. HMF7620]|uniref:Uncharacterized protein n=1 Tax=Deinococcus arboris TaxID=2682977 RepID=A0A7C9LTK7_9DEIO|nr:hypothetical protein [Deinococcus arboris]MVN89141.1 hypothetical protein [Deinococcus arboris]
MMISRRMWGPWPSRALCPNGQTSSSSCSANAEFKEIVGPQGVVYLWWPVPGGKNEFSVTAFSPRTQRMTMKHRTFRTDEEERAIAYARGLATEILAGMDRAGLILDAPAQA